MKIYIITVVGFFAFLFSFIVLYGVEVSEPILPLREAGEYAPRIEELRKIARDSKKLVEFEAKAYQLIMEIEAKREGRQTKEKSKFDVTTREEFAALEWTYYFIVISPSPTQQEIITYKSPYLAPLSHFSIEPWEFIEKQRIDREQLRKKRVAYCATYIKKRRAQVEKLENEKLAWEERGVRYIEARINLVKKYDWKWFSHTTNEERAEISSMRTNLYNTRASVISLDIHLQRQFLREEDQFFFRALKFFSKKPEAIEPYLKLAGYDNESKRGDLLYRMHEETLDNIWKERLFAPYAQKIRFKPEEAKKSFFYEKERKKKELAQKKKKWDERLVELKREEEKIKAEIHERYIKFHKEADTSSKQNSTIRGGSGI